MQSQPNFNIRTFKFEQMLEHCQDIESEIVERIQEVQAASFLEIIKLLVSPRWAILFQQACAHYSEKMDEHLVLELLKIECDFYWLIYPPNLSNFESVAI
jgi:hypothetical protein